jgi:hypothetical protein
MKKLLVIIILLNSFTGIGQNFLNGGFEINTAVGNQINLSAALYNSTMANSVSFGTLCNIDIITDTNFCGVGAQQGSWYVALTGGSTDAISLELSAPLNIGQTYTVSFYDRWGIPPSSAVYPFQIGLSATDTSFGSLIYTAPDANACVWTLRTFTFVAPSNGQFITVKIAGGSEGDTWCHIDNFTMQLPESVNSVAENNEMQIFPNPFTSQTTLSFDEEQKNTTVQITDVLGKTILQGTINGRLYVIDMSEKAKGVYFVRIMDEKRKVVNKKIIIN